jgi:cytoskeletal protein CcmA (bactofilin family)
MSDNSNESQQSGPMIKGDLSEPNNSSRATQFHPDVPRRTAKTSDSNVIRPVETFNPEKKLLTVGRDMTLSSAEISDCDRLVVEGTIEGNLISGNYLQIDQSGVFKGSAVVDSAEIAGIFEGDLKVYDRLFVHESGVVKGRVLYGKLEIEYGGQLNGEAQSSSEELISNQPNSDLTGQTL